MAKKRDCKCARLILFTDFNEYKEIGLDIDAIYITK